MRQDVKHTKDLKRKHHKDKFEDAAELYTTDDRTLDWVLEQGSVRGYVPTSRIRKEK